MPRLSLLGVLASALGAANALDVFAHFMITNSYAYDLDQWKTDFGLAQQMGVDGFALNFAAPHCDPQSDLGWFETQIDKAYTAAEQYGSFKLYLSFDMDRSDCGQKGGTFFTQQYMHDMITKYAGNKATYRWNNNIVVTTFGGDTVSAYGNGFFDGLKNMMKSSNPISLAPALTDYSYKAQDDASGATSSLLHDYPSIDGYKNWQAWPLSRAQNMTTAVDQAFSSALKGASKQGPYIMTASPWQFKNWPDLPDSSWVAYADTLWVDRWTSLVANNAFRPDVIEIISWNDWPESHYIRNSPDWVDTSALDYCELGNVFDTYVRGQVHAPWRIIAAHYIAKIKGITRNNVDEQAVFWYRINPKAACNSGIRDYELVEDAVFVWAEVHEAATLRLTVGSNSVDFPADPMNPGVFKVAFPSNLGSGVTPAVYIIRNGKNVQARYGLKPITNSCSSPNFNPIVSVAGLGTVSME